MRPDFHFPSSHANVYKGKLSLLDCSIEEAPDLIQKTGSLGGGRLTQKSMCTQNKNQAASQDLGLFNQTE